MVSSRPSPGADPRIEAMVAEWDNRAGYELHPLERHVRAFLAAADAADPLRQPGIVRVDTRDEATVERIVLALCVDHGHVDRPGSAACRTCNRRARAVLAALAGEQHG